jgi:hypothetical protein
MIEGATIPKGSQHRQDRKRKKEMKMKSREEKRRRAEVAEKGDE